MKERIEDQAAAQMESASEKAPSTGLTATFSPGVPVAKGRNWDAVKERIENGPKTGWLTAIAIALEPVRKNDREKAAVRRTSNRGCLPMTLDGYLKLLDCTGRPLRKHIQCRIPAECAPILERLVCRAELWFDLVKHFRKRLRNQPGSLPSVRALRSSCRERRTQAATV